MGDEMKIPNYEKIKIILSKNRDPKTQDYILNKMSNEDAIYEYTKVFGAHDIPREEAK